MRQLTFEDVGRGGSRRGAGRPKVKGAGVSHQTRSRLSRHHPVHVTMRVREGLPSLRTRRCFTALKHAFERGKNRFGMRLVHYSVQSNHMHLIVEVEDEKALTRGMQGLNIRMARALNRCLRRKGKVFVDRFHAHVLKTPRQVRNALAYVLNNWRRHAAQSGWEYAKKLMDVFASGMNFDGWRSKPSRPSTGFDAEMLLPSASTWLLRLGWRRRGLIDPGEVPGPMT